MPFNNAENCKNYRERKKKNAPLKVKVIRKTNAEKCRMYRLRKKQLAQGYKSSVNEDLYTPSTSNSQATLGSSPQPVTSTIGNNFSHFMSLNFQIFISSG